jgi:hypothetical protein
LGIISYCMKKRINCDNNLHANISFNSSFPAAT